MRKSALRAHIQIPQAGPRLDPPETARPGRRRPLDLADHCLLRPAVSRPAPRRRPAPALAAALPARPPHPSPCPRRLPAHPPGTPRSRQRAETLQARPRPPSRIEEPPARHPPRRRQARQANRDQDQEPAGRQGRVARGISAPGSHGTVLNSRPLHGSSHLLHQNWLCQAQCLNSPGSRPTSPFHQALRRLKERSLLYFRRAQRAR
jgi:hypothetical protein